MLILIGLKVSQDFQENIGVKKDGSLKKILQDGFNGIVDFVMEEEFLTQMKYKLKDGKILEDMFWQLKKIVKKMTLDAEEGRDKLYFSGLTTLSFNFSFKINSIF